MSANPWAQEWPPCPSWCVNGADHLPDNVDRLRGTYFHKGAPVVFRSVDDPSPAPLLIRTYLAREVRNDERGFFSFPTRVVADCGFTPATARDLAARLVALADEAERDG